MMPARRRATPTPAQRTQWADERQEKLADLHARIVDQVATLTNGDQWRAWLQFATQFHTYSFNNTIAIWMQAPHATWVAGFKRWAQLGRHVRKGEHGIAILAPMTARKTDPAAPAGPDSADPPPPVGPAGTPGVIELTGATVTAFIEAALNQLDGGEPQRPGRILRGFKIATVFDITQTDGPDIDAPTRPGRADVEATLLSGQAPDGVWDALVAIADEHGYRVERGYCDGANGYIRWADHLIKVRDDVDDAQAVKTMIHELGHALLHDPADFVDGWTAACRGEKEVEAESTAFLVAAHVGLDTSDYTFGYVTGWAERAVATTQKAPHEIVQATGARVVRAAATLTAALDTAVGHGEEPVTAELAQRVDTGVRTAAEARVVAETALVEAGQAQPGLFDTPPAAGRAFPPPARPGQAALPALPPGPQAPASIRRHR
jgi:DNA primase